VRADDAIGRWAELLVRYDAGNAAKPGRYKPFAEVDMEDLRAVLERVVQGGAHAEQALRLTEDVWRLKLLFTVLGEPAPGGSKDGFYSKKLNRVIITDASKGAPAWKKKVKAAAEAAMAAKGYTAPLAGPLHFEMTFYVERPAGHYGTGRNAGVLKGSARIRPTVAPDTTKLVRAAEDAMTKVVWPDDCWVVDQVARKVYGSPARCEVAVYELVAEAGL